MTTLFSTKTGSQVDVADCGFQDTALLIWLAGVLPWLMVAVLFVSIPHAYAGDRKGYLKKTHCSKIESTFMTATGLSMVI